MKKKSIQNPFPNGVEYSFKVFFVLVFFVLAVGIGHRFLENIPSIQIFLIFFSRGAFYFIPFYFMAYVYAFYVNPIYNKENSFSKTIITLFGIIIFLLYSYFLLQPAYFNLIRSENPQIIYSSICFIVLLVIAYFVVISYKKYEDNSKKTLKNIMGK